MKGIYMSLSILYFNDPRIQPECVLYEKVDDQKMTRKEMKLHNAQLLMWDLVLSGAKRTVSSNMFDPTISTVNVTLWMRH